jgi:hypothetical protein
LTAADAVGVGAATGEAGLSGNISSAVVYSQGVGGERQAAQSVVSGVAAGATVTGQGVGVSYVITPTTVAAAGVAGGRGMTPDLNVMGTGADTEGAAVSDASTGASATTGAGTIFTPGAAAVTSAGAANVLGLTTLVTTGRVVSAAASTVVGVGNLKTTAGAAGAVTAAGKTVVIGVGHRKGAPLTPPNVIAKGGYPPAKRKYDESIERDEAEIMSLMPFIMSHIAKQQPPPKKQ